MTVTVLMTAGIMMFLVEDSSSGLGGFLDDRKQDANCQIQQTQFDKHATAQQTILQNLHQKQTASSRKQKAMDVAGLMRTIIRQEAAVIPAQ